VLVLMGRWAWWMPPLLGRLVPRVDIEGAGLTEHGQPPPPEPETATGE
jgi:putative drug exporter of the RND superfamily